MHAFFQCQRLRTVAQPWVRPRRRERGSGILAGLAALLALASPSVAAGAQRIAEEVGSRRPTKVVVRERAAPPKVGSVVVLAKVQGAEVSLLRLRPTNARMRRISGITDSSGSVSFHSLRPGLYKVAVRRDEYVEFTREIAVAAGKALMLDAALRPTFGHLVLTGPRLTRDAAVFLDGRLLPGPELVRGGPETIRIKARTGAHDVAVERIGHARFSSTLTVEPGGDTAVAVVLEPLRATLRIRSLPGARVYVSGEPAGIVASTGELTVGGLAPEVAHRVRVEKDTYVAFLRTVRVDPARDTVVEAMLERQPTSGPFEDYFLSGLTLWDAPESWRGDPARGVLVVQGSPRPGMPKGLHYQDCEVTFTLRLLGDRGAAWVVHARDERNGYLFYLTGPGSPWANQLRTYVLRDGRCDLATPNAPALPLTPGLSTTDFYQVRLRSESGVIRVWLTPSSTGKEIAVGVYQDLDSTFTSGNVGLVALDGTRFEVDSFLVHPFRGASSAKSDPQQ